MEDTQRIAFGKIMDLMKVTDEERENATRGLELFIEHGWPSEYVKVGMALAAGRGLIPFPYEGIGSDSRYKQMMEASSS